MSISKSFSSQGQQTTYIDLGWGNVAIGIKTDDEFGSLVFDNIKKSKPLGMPVKTEEIERDENQVVITFPGNTADELDLLIIRLLELRQAQYGPQPSSFS